MRIFFNVSLLMEGGSLLMEGPLLEIENSCFIRATWLWSWLIMELCYEPFMFLSVLNPAPEERLGGCGAVLDVVGASD